MTDIPVAPFFSVGAVGMALGTLVFAYVAATDSGNRLYHVLLTFVSGIAAVAYGLMVLRVGAMPVAVPGTGGARTVDVIRYVDWVLTTPILIFYLGLLAGIGRQYLVGLVVLDLGMLGAGLGGALTTGTVSWALFGLGMVFYLPLMYGLTVGIREAVADRPAAVRALFQKLRNLTVIIWTVYPVVWVLGPAGAGLVSYPIAVISITYADLIAKVGFGLIAVNSQQTLARLPQLDALGSFNPTDA